MIAVIIPSLNEEKNISKVTKLADEGVVKYFSKYRTDIVNADSDSLDETVHIFKKVSTKSKKISIINKKRGKGVNIYASLKKTFNDNDYFLTLDADVKSGKISWVKNFLDPIINEEYDLVVPIYTRNRFEGNTTNHFSSPITFAVFGIDILQPIAGDFSFNKKVATNLIRNFNIESDFQYGIDALLVTLAVLNKFKIKQIFLGKKIHNPSFEKIYPIFTQEATSMFYLINKFRAIIIKNKFRFYKDSPSKKNLVADKSYVNKPKEKEILDMKNKSILQIKKNLKLYKKILNVDLLDNIKNQEYKINYSLWNSILFDYLKLFLTAKLSKEKIISISHSLFPLYILRTISYFDEINNLKSEDINSIFLRQKTELRNLMKKIISK